MEQMEKNGKKKKLISAQMLGYEFRNVIGNPYVHIFGVGMPVMMAVLICRMVVSEIPDASALAAAVTSIFLGIGAMIPMATVLMGYAVSHARDVEKEVPLRMELFGIQRRVSLCNNALAELIFMLIAFAIYFAAGFAVVGIETPKAAGGLLYLLCILVLSGILFCLAYAISSLLKKFGATYCVTMILYFAFMIFSGMMGITYDAMPEALQAVARMLPTMYLNRDFYTVWRGESYDFMPMIQAYLLLAAVSGILLFYTVKRTARTRHNVQR